MGSSRNLTGISVLLSFVFIAKRNCTHCYTATQGKMSKPGQQGSSAMIFYVNFSKIPAAVICE